MLTTDYDTSNFRKVPGLGKPDRWISKRRLFLAFLIGCEGSHTTRQGISESCPVMRMGLSSGQSLTMWSGRDRLLYEIPGPAAQGTDSLDEREREEGRIGPDNLPRAELSGVGIVSPGYHFHCP